jgi:hypothetical protein
LTESGPAVIRRPSGSQAKPSWHHLECLASFLTWKSLAITPVGRPGAVWGRRVLVILAGPHASHGGTGGSQAYHQKWPNNGLSQVGGFRVPLSVWLNFHFISTVDKSQQANIPTRQFLLGKYLR